MGPTQIQYTLLKKIATHSFTCLVFQYNEERQILTDFQLEEEETLVLHTDGAFDQISFDRRSQTYPVQKEMA